MAKEGIGVKAAVTGCGGRMGSRIVALIEETEGIELVGAVEALGDIQKGKRGV